MAGVLRRFFGTFFKEPRAQLPPPPLNSSPTMPSRSEVTHGSSFLELEGTRFRLAANADQLAAATTTDDRIALRLSTKDYKEVMGALIDRFELRYDLDTPEYQALKYATLVCAGCGWEFPGSYIMSLIGAFGSSRTGSRRVAGASPGFAEFGKTGSCTQCGDRASFLVYERIAPSEIRESDVIAIRRYWRHLAVEWWLGEGRTKGICDRCNCRIGRERTYLVGETHLQCETCTDQNLTNALDELRQNPYQFGATLLRKARQH